MIDAGAIHRRWWSRRHRLAVVGWLYALPTAVVVGFLFVVPIVMAVWMSLNRWPILGEPTLNFPANYAAIPRDFLFVQAIGFTILYTVIITVVLLGLGLFLALLVEGQSRVVGVLRTAYFLPAVVGLTAAALLFYALYAPGFGPINPILQDLGLIDDPIRWLGSPNTALFSVILMMTWKFAGFYMIILLVGLQGIPRELYEAARIDGAGRLQSLRYITLPLLRPSIALCLVLMISGAMLAFENFFVMTQGGPDRSTVTMVMAIFRAAFSQLDLGRGAALAIVLMTALVVFNALWLTLARRGQT
jgi:multiple sugar transport system permease protein